MSAPDVGPDGGGGSGPQAEDGTAGRDDRSTGELIAQATDDISTLIRTELALAKQDIAESGKRAGIGVGAFGAAGLFALYGLGALIATAILALANPLDPWLSALIVAGSLFLVAGVAALYGKSRIGSVGEPPKERVESVQDDVALIKDPGKAES